ncbi:MAG TPA: hypothetical protein DEF47_22135 [Herpetosiphon sp.]|uniref:Uncharacterized protein n=1 Tax=Herpetosiphon aurantiacus (strain ATCC 23779 / DSM 785 / 114-95) TaxID=316274 RepID=A9AW53_HERA2|nr:hypothetical protein [Herpetosiphon sp.]ABX03291.1 hypothetical protein Haur_0643 [Herpetosiphon aurantiacus DSM 785]HBW52589.1 hypothetical protein [Herpetosiphon sp.]
MADTTPSPSSIKVEHQIHFTLDGFPCTTSVAGATADQLKVVIDRLKAIGAQPPTTHPAHPTQPVAAVAPPSVPAQRLCPTHGTPLQLRQGTRRGGKPYKFWSCNHTDADGNWCDHTEKP